MSDSIRTCKDGHRCENGSLCNEDPSDEGSYYCDCSTAVGDFAGLFCEYEAKEYCKFPQEVTSSWFCTNQGTCVVSVEGDKSAWNCDCLDEYEGPHCEFIKGALPKGWPGLNQPSSVSAPRKGDEGLEAGIMSLIILVSLVVVGLIAFFIVQKRRSGEKNNAAENAVKDHSEALKLEADGSAFKESLKSQNNFETVNGFSLEVGSDGNSVEYHDSAENSNGVGHGRMV